MIQGTSSSAGKTTLVKTTFTQFTYVNLEDFENRTLALNDPKRFMLKYPEGAIFDEIQRVPLLLSYIQVRVDELEKKGSDLIPIEIKSSKTFSTSFLDGLDLLSNKVLQISL